MPFRNLLNKIPKPGQLGVTQNGPRTIQKGESFNKKLAIRGSLVIALVAGFFVLTTHADTDCRELTLAPFTSGECVQKLKVMVNKVSGSNLDVNNPGFDGELNNQLIRMEAFNAFAPYHYNSQQWVWRGIWDVTNQHYNVAIDKDNAAAAAAAQKAAEEAAAPPAPPAPAPTAVPCREQNLTPFSSGDCVKIIKALVNFVSGSNLDVNNPGFDGPLHQQLINMDKFNAFTPNHYTDRVTPEIYDKLVELRDAKQNAPPVVTPPPAPVQAECKDQGLKVGATGGCVRLLRASINVIYKQYHQQTPLKDAERFDDLTSGTIKILVESGELGNNAKFRGYKGVVNAELWNDIMQISSQINQATTGSTNPASEPVTTSTVDTKASPSVDGNCDTADMQRGSHGGCVRILHAMLNKLGAGQVSAATDTFDDTTASVLVVTINTYGLAGTSKGDYKGIVTPSIWNALVSAIQEKDRPKSILEKAGSSVGVAISGALRGGSTGQKGGQPDCKTAEGQKTQFCKDFFNAVANAQASQAATGQSNTQHGAGNSNRGTWYEYDPWTGAATPIPSDQLAFTCELRDNSYAPDNSQLPILANIDQLTSDSNNCIKIAQMYRAANSAGTAQITSALSGSKCVLTAVESGIKLGWSVPIPPTPPGVPTNYMFDGLGAVDSSKYSNADRNGNVLTFSKTHANTKDECIRQAQNSRANQKKYNVNNIKSSLVAKRK